MLLCLLMAISILNTKAIFVSEDWVCIACVVLDTMGMHFIAMILVSIVAIPSIVMGGLLCHCVDS